MDLRWTEREESFRARARAWLESHVPHDLPLGTTRDGFAACVEWEKQLYDARWAVVAWPRRYGGRDATLWEWLIFEEEYYRAGGAAAGHPERDLPARADAVRVRHPAAAGPLPAPDGRGPGPVVPGLVRARRGQRPGGRAQQRRPRRDGRRLACCPGRRPGRRAARSARTCSACSAPTRPPSGTGASPTSWCRWTRRGSRCAASTGSTAMRSSRTCSSTTSSCPTSDVLGEVNQGWQVAMADDRLRARADAPLPRTVPGQRRPAGRAVPAASGTGAARPGGAVVDRCSGLPPVHVAAGHGHHRGRRAARARSRA